MAKVVYPTQIVYVKQGKTVTSTERREQDGSSWLYTTYINPQSSYSYSGTNFSNESLVYPTTTYTASWSSWVKIGEDDDGETQQRTKTERTASCMTLLKFDTSIFKSGKPVYLNLYASSGGSTAAALDVYKITEAWDASTVTWTNKPAMTKILSGQSFPLNTWVAIDVQSLLGGHGIALRDENYGSGTDREKAIQKTGTYAPTLTQDAAGVWVQTANGLKEGEVYVQTANGLKPGEVYVQTENGLKQSS